MLGLFGLQGLEFRLLSVLMRQGLDRGNCPPFKILRILCLLGCRVHRVVRDFLQPETAPRNAAGSLGGGVGSGIWVYGLWLKV